MLMLITLIEDVPSEVMVWATFLASGGCDTELETLQHIGAVLGRKVVAQKSKVHITSFSWGLPLPQKEHDPLLGELATDWNWEVTPQLCAKGDILSQEEQVAKPGLAGQSLECCRLDALVQNKPHSLTLLQQRAICKTSGYARTSSINTQQTGYEEQE
ncbi:hypothetical protein WISP_139074 [Willisornis vidua]|uniref:Uncharacterized protein n=1 Tax=Willisornis vidua TaxID=1566151 RepID=A0ABQ9CSA8_9PASS|nr:hypothetical protein WISP_139074 [Willisornis vidua]